jgi:hypothetical protein
MSQTSRTATMFKCIRHHKLLSISWSRHRLVDLNSFSTGKNRQYTVANHQKDNTIVLAAAAAKKQNFEKLFRHFDLFLKELKRKNWINHHCSDYLEELVIANKSNSHFQHVLIKLNQRSNHELNESIDFFQSNLAQLSVKEQSVLFHVISFLNLKGSKSHELILMLEEKFYDQIEQCDMDDILNYQKGFSVFR